MATITKEKQTRKPRASKKLNYDQVLSQAQALSLGDKAELVKELKRQITSETTQLRASVDEAVKATEGI